MTEPSIIEIIKSSYDLEACELIRAKGCVSGACNKHNDIKSTNKLFDHISGEDITSFLEEIINSRDVTDRYIEIAHACGSTLEDRYEIEREYNKLFTNSNNKEELYGAVDPEEVLWVMEKTLNKPQLEEFKKNLIWMLIEYSTDLILDEHEESSTEKIKRKEQRTAAEYLDSGCDKDDQKDSKGAIEDYSKAIELNPNYAEAYANRGCAKEELGDKGGAISDWQKAADLGDEEAAKWIEELRAKNPKITTDKNVFTQLINYDLQKDYVDKLSEEEKLELFRGLTWEIEKIADKNWNSEENYTEEFMVNWITNSYAKEVLTPFENALDAEDEDDEYEPWDDHLLIFTFNEKFKDFDDYEVEAYQINEEDNQISFQCPSFWLDVPREFLISWALEFYEIEAKFVEDMTMYG